MASSSERWQALKALFDTALELDSAARSTFLRDHCPDAEARAEVERLLEDHDQAGTFLSTPALGDFTLEAEHPHQRLSPNDLLAERFRIVRFIAGGGMGEVYEAEDEELHERVAIKIIGPEVLAQPNAVTRFKREVHLARKVTNPNVCRIFDLFRHRPEHGDRKTETVFVSMELLHGETLAEHLKAARCLTESDAQPLVEQMASALGAAHAAGIVHRDFKPGNVVLVGAQKTWRAVVTDFGLALRSLKSGEVGSHSTGQTLLGTLAYMSPEQLEGRPATPASDIYSLGLVIYEMVTGTRPFKGHTPISAALKRLSEAPAPPRSLQPGLSLEWQQVILRCLELNPADRFGNAADIASALHGEHHSSRATRTPFRMPMRKSLVLGLSALLVVILGITGFRRLRMSRTPNMAGAAFAVAPRRSVAVLGFKNLSGRTELDWISTALSEELTDELAAGEQLRTVPGERVARLKADLSLPSTDTLGSEKLSEIRKALGTEIVVSGSYLEVGNRLRVDVQLLDTLTGAAIATVSDTVNEDQLLDLVSRVGGTLRTKCGLVQLTSAQAQAVKTAQTTTPLAARFYAEGLEKLRSFDALGARTLFEKAIAADDKYAMAHSALASAWLQLGYDVKAKEEAGKAVDLGSGLNREDRLWIEAQFHEAAHEPSKAVESYQTLFSTSPDNPEYGLRLVNAQLLSGAPADAQTTLADLRKLPVPAEDARIDLAEANVERSLGDSKQSLAAALVAEHKAESSGNRMVAGLSLMRQSSALDLLGQQEEALARGEKARRIFSEAGDRDDFAKVNSNLALILVRQSKFEEAKRRYQESLEEFRAIGDRHAEEVMYGQLAWVAEHQDDLNGAQKLYEQSLALARELDDKSRIADCIGSIALILSYRGDLSGAISRKEEVLAIAKESGQTQLETQTSVDLSGMLLAQGDLTGARELLVQADGLLAKTRNNRSKALSSQAWGDILTSEDRLAEAHQKYQDAINTAVRGNEKQLVPYCQMSLAELEIEEHRITDSETLLEEAEDYFHAQKNKGGEAWALGIYVRAEQESGNISAALKKARVAKVLAAHDRSLSGLDVDLAVARVEGVSGNRRLAEKELKNLLTEAEKQKNVLLALKVRLALGEIAFRSHEPSARKALTTLSSNAEAKGFLLVSKKARTLAGVQ